jgi:MFS family permease
MKQPRFASSYPANALLVILSISPGLLNGAALNYVFPSIARDFGAAPASVFWLPTLGDAAIAFGGIVAAELARHVEARRLYLATLIVAILSCILATLATDVLALILTQTIRGMVAGFMLVIALGPLIAGFGQAKLPVTTAIAIAALFGVASLGPIVGAFADSIQYGWRYMFAVEMLLGLCAFWLAYNTLGERPPQRTSNYVDWPAIVLAIATTILNFCGVAAFMQHRWYEPAVWVPLTLGNAGLIALFVIEARSPDPLLPVKELRRAYPLIGAFACVFASGAYAAAQRGVAFFLTFIQARDQLTVAAVLSFAVIGALVAAPIYARVVATRWGAPMALVGLILLGIGSFAGTTFGTDRPLFATVVVVVILALGAGLTITPGLLTMALGVQGHFVGRAIALLALLRTEASYLTGPIATIFAASRGHHYAAQICLRCPDYNMDLDSVQRIVIGGTTGLINRAFPKPVLDAYLSGIHEGFLALTVLTAVAIVFVVVIFWRSGVHLVAPRIGCFLSDGVALESPPLFSDPAK